MRRNYESQSQTIGGLVAVVEAVAAELLGSVYIGLYIQKKNWKYKFYTFCDAKYEGN
jgi:hypothetical protein